jgi:hypothetical protein
VKSERFGTLLISSLRFWPLASIELLERVREGAGTGTGTGTGAPQVTRNCGFRSVGTRRVVRFASRHHRGPDLLALEQRRGEIVDYLFVAGEPDVTSTYAPVRIPVVIATFWRRESCTT